MKKTPLHLFVFSFSFCLCVVALQANEQNLFETYLDNAITAFKNGDRQEAAEFFKKCVEIDPNNYHIWYWGGIFSQDVDMAEQAFDHAIKLEPHEPNAYALRGQLRLVKSESTGNALQRMKHFIDGMADLDKALHLDPNNVIACYIKAFTLLRHEQHGRYEEAIAYFQLVLKTMVNKEETLKNRHIHDYRRLAYLGLATIHNRLQNFNKALGYVDKAIELASMSEDNNAAMTISYRLRYQTNYHINKKNALSDLEMILEHDPSLLIALTYQKTLLLLELGLKEEATDFCRMMLKTLDSDDHTRLIYIYCLGFKCNEMEEAAKHIDAYDEKKLQEDYRAGLISNSDLRFFYETRCFMNIARNRLEEAYSDNATKMDLERGTTRSYLVRALLLLLMDKKEEARVSLDVYLPLLHEEILPTAALSEVWPSGDGGGKGVKEEKVKEEKRCQEEEKVSEEEVSEEEVSEEEVSEVNTAVTP